MRRRSMVAIIGVSALLLAGAATGITLAAVYTNPSENYAFNGSSSGTEEPFQTFSIAHYFHGGTGADSSHAYEIANPIELRNLSKLQARGLIAAGTYFKLLNSFTWSGDDLTPIGADSSHAWAGKFDGGGKVIHGLQITASGSYGGMFGYVDGGEVQNFVLSAPKLTTSGASTSGFAVGYLKAGSACTKIGIYGGTEYLKCRAVMELGGATTNANCIVGSGSATKLNFIPSVTANLDVETAKTFATATTAGTYNLWLDGASVRNGERPS